MDNRCARLGCVVGIHHGKWGFSPSAVHPFWCCHGGSLDVMRREGCSKYTRCPKSPHEVHLNRVGVSHSHRFATVPHTNLCRVVSSGKISVQNLRSLTARAWQSFLKYRAADRHTEHRNKHAASDSCGEGGATALHANQAAKRKPKQLIAVCNHTNTVTKLRQKSPVEIVKYPGQSIRHQESWINSLSPPLWGSLWILNKLFPPRLQTRVVPEWLDA